MTIGQEIEGLAADAVPGVLEAKVGISAAKAIVIGIGALLLCGLLAWVGWKLFFAEHAAEMKHDVAAAKAGELVGKAQGGAGNHAANVIAGNGQKETVINNTTRTNYVEITKAPGAGDPVTDAVDAAGRRAVCMRASAASLPDCIRLRGPDPQ